MAEYAVIALLATLLAAPGATLAQQPATPAASADPRVQAAGDTRPGVIQAGAKLVRAVTAATRAVAGAARWLAELWRQANRKAEPTKGEAMAAWPVSPPPTSSSTWRSP